MSETGIKLKADCELAKAISSHAWATVVLLPHVIKELEAGEWVDTDDFEDELCRQWLDTRTHLLEVIRDIAVDATAVHVTVGQVRRTVNEIMGCEQ